MRGAGRRAVGGVSARARAVASKGGSTMSGIARRVRPGAASRPPWERSILDDLAMKRPWNVVVKAARAAARVRNRLRPLRRGVTVVIVSWNTKEVLADVLGAVLRLSPEGTEVLVVDNGSTDGTRSMLRDLGAVRTLRLPANAGHGVALDLGLCAVRTRVAVTLDSDAVPLTPEWLRPAVDPVASGAAKLAGLRARRGFVHPVYLAVDTETFLRHRLSFQVHVRPDIPRDEIVWGVTGWDTAELLTPRLAADEVVLIPRTENPAAGLPGMTTGGVVYHHGGMTRTGGGALTAEALDGWRSALRALGVARGGADRA